MGDKKRKMKGMKIMFLLMIGSILIASLWNSVPMIKDSVHLILDPTAGKILDWNLTYGMFALVLMLSLFMTLAQKYLTDQEALRELKKEQKILQEEMKKYRDHPEKLMELQKKQFEFVPKTMNLTMSSALYTFVPLILMFRWFFDYFSDIQFKFLGFLSWFWFYLIFSIIFSSILRKSLKVA